MLRFKFTSILFLAAAFIICMPYTALADFTVSAGDTWTLLADENFIVDGNLTIEAGGTLDASAANTNISLSGNWTNNGTFIPGTTTITINGSGTTVINGSNTFYNFTCVTPSKQITFAAGSTQTVTNTLTLNGQATGTEVVLRSSVSGTRFTFNVTGSAQSVEYVDVKDSNASGNNIVAADSTNSGNTDSAESPPYWVFGSVASITYPEDGKTVSRQPTIIGTTGPDETVEIYAIVDGTSTKVAEVIADGSGNYRVTQSDLTASLDIGSNSLTPRVGGVNGAAVSITDESAPDTTEVPTITSPTDGSSVSGSKPTITGKGVAGQSVTLYARDADGNLLLSNVASATVDSSGNYTIDSSDYTTELPKGTVYLSVEVDGVNSETVEAVFVDPFGIVFDSVSNNPIENAVVTLYYDNDPGAGRTWIQAVPGTHILATDANPQTTGATGFYSFNCISGDYYMDISATGYTYPSTESSFPAGRTIVTGSQGEVFTVGAVIIEMDHPVDPSEALLRIEKDANKRDVVVGDIVTYTVTMENVSGSDVTGVLLEDLIPTGFKYVNNRAILDGTPISDPTGTRPVNFNVGTVAAGATRTLKYQLVVGSGVNIGDHKNIAYAKYAGGRVISNRASEKVTVILDPVFNLGTVIGKVFHDGNENGIQDKGEEPIGNVEIVTEDGTIITTDKNGMYHLAGIMPGRHLFRLDERDLPDGSRLTTDLGVIVDIREGLMSKVNFGVKLPDTTVVAPFTVTTDSAKPEPRLNVALLNDELVIRNGRLKEAAEFRIFTNYHLFIKKWTLEIRDKNTSKLIKSFSGDRNNIFDPISWNTSFLLRPERRYAYRLTVTGKGGKKDVTLDRDIPIREIEAEIGSLGDKDRTSELDKKRARLNRIASESKVDSLKTQTIKIDGEIVKVKGLKGRSIRVLKGNKVQTELVPTASKGYSAKDMLDGKSESDVASFGDVELILPKGEYDFQLGEGSVASEGAQTLTYVEGAAGAGASSDQGYIKHLKVGDDYLFLVALGDAKTGYNFNSGDIDPADNDELDDGFWVDGKLAFYLKGKIKGKYLVTASYDSERDKEELFRNLDPDKYYLVYGDASSVNYDATDTQGNLYLLVEWAESSVLWGNYNTGFTDTELAQFRRTLYGGKAHLKSVANTKYGDPSSEVVAFGAEAYQQSSHNELLGTGGSLYYLKHKRIIEGSEKIGIEVRDKVTGLALTTVHMKEGVDYEIDYDNGRIIFWKPVSHVAVSNSIISGNLLDGNPVYIIADYEYGVFEYEAKDTMGARGKQAIGDHVVIGGTYVEEDQTGGTYTLQGADATVYVTDDIKITAEYAESESEANANYISTDGGLSFTELPTSQNSSGKAYSVMAEAYFLENRLGLESYYKYLDHDFSSTATSSQQGKELSGVRAIYDLSERTRVTMAHDVQKLLDDGNSQTQLQVGATETATTSAQIVHDSNNLTLTAEFRHQEVTGRKDEYESEVNEEQDVLAVRADYKLSEKTIVSLEHQATSGGEANNQTTVGIETKINDSLAVRVAESVGDKGSATTAGVTSRIGKKFELAADLTKAKYSDGRAGNLASVTANTKVNDKTDLYTTLSETDEIGGGKVSSMRFGGRRKINDELEVTSDRLYSSSGRTKTTGSRFGFLRERDGKVLEGTFSKEQAVSSSETSNSNIFGLSGDINDNWAFSGAFERGEVQNHDGSRTTRNAGSVGLGYVVKGEEPEEVTFKASAKIGLRYDDGLEDKRQYLVYTAVEGRVNPDTTLFAKANLSETKNTTANTTDAKYTELVCGFAYRPIDFDKLNLLAKYTFLEDVAPDGQSDSRDIEAEKAHVFAAEAVYDLNESWQLAEKVAYKTGKEKVAGFDFTKSETWLWINRLGYGINDDWQVFGEYRILSQVQADDQKQGALFEITRDIKDVFQIGVGYNFTEFNDDLAHLDYTSQGPFIRVTGKLLF